jgi:hypothetical protein
MNSNYTLVKGQNEFIDYPILNSNNIRMNINVSDAGKISKITISDMCSGGFINILSQGNENPFNMGHIRNGHISDNDISEYGTGMKQAAIALGGRLTVYTKLLDGAMYNVVLDFEDMANKEDVLESYNFTKFSEINETEYKNIHPFDIGSTIVLENINDTIYKTTTLESINDFVSEALSKTYGMIIRDRNVVMKVNDVTIVPPTNYFEEPQCRPFNETRHLFIYNHETAGQIIIEYNVNKNRYKKYSRDEHRFTKIRVSEFNTIRDTYPSYYSDEGEYDDDGSILRINGTGTMFHPDSNRVGDDNEANQYLPKCKTRIYKQGRLHGNPSFTSGSNGSLNFVDTNMTFNSKQLGKDIGITWNKEITLEKDNDIVQAIKWIIKDIGSELSYDTSTMKASKLYEKALQNGIIVPVARIPTKLRPERQPGGPPPVPQQEHEVVEEPDVVEEQDVVVDVDEDNDSVISILTDVTPTQIEMGPGTQTRMKKGQIENVFKKIKNKIEDVNITNRKAFETRASMCVADMLHEISNHNTRIPEYVYDLAISNGFIANTEVYLSKLENKVPTDYVPGGSKMAKFMWDYLKSEYDSLEEVGQEEEE